MNRADMPAECIKPCDTCKTPIVWTKTDRDARHPVDLDPTPTGNLRLTVAGKIVRSHAVPAKLAFGRIDLHLSHFVRCPQADTHRRSRRRPIR